MLRSFIESDVYRVMLGCEQADVLLETLRAHGISHDGKLRVMRRDDGYALVITVVLLDGDTLQKLALGRVVELMQIDNMSARLRAVPAMPNLHEAEARSRLAGQRYGQRV